MLCEKGKKIGSSEATLLQMLDIRPFVYGAKITNCFDVSMFPPKFLEFSESELFRTMSHGAGPAAAMSMALSHPSLLAFPHVVSNGFKNLVAVSVETDYNFKQAEDIKKYLDTAVVTTLVNTPTLGTIVIDVGDVGDIGGNDRDGDSDTDLGEDPLFDFF